MLFFVFFLIGVVLFYTFLFFPFTTAAIVLLAVLYLAGKKASSFSWSLSSVPPMRLFDTTRLRISIYKRTDLAKGTITSTRRRPQAAP